MTIPMSSPETSLHREFQKECLREGLTMSTSPFKNDQPDESTPPFPADIRWARRLAWWLDEAISIPGLQKNIGLDPILGLIPGLGDGLTALISFYPVWLAYRYQLSVWIGLKMIRNIAIDTLVGSVPLLGDLFDAGWKANSMNADLLEAEYLKKYPLDASKQVIDI